MIPIFKTKIIDVSFENNVFQETKSSSEHIADYMNGNASPDVPMGASHDFENVDSVDFNADLVPTHHDIFEVASGQDKVFKDVNVVDSPAPAPENSAPIVENVE